MGASWYSRRVRLWGVCLAVSVWVLRVGRLRGAVVQLSMPVS